jgi:hypothetical protein
MRKEIIILFVALILLINQVSALEFFQYIQDRGNNTIRSHGYVFYSMQDGTENYINDGKPLEFYIDYYALIDTWNNINPKNNVTYCNLAGIQYSNITGSTTQAFNKNLTGDVSNSKQFVVLYPDDSLSINLDCFYQNNATLIMPANFQIVTPSFACKSCQFYKWTLSTIESNKVKTLKTNFFLTFEYIKKIILLNYEVIIILYWIVLISLLLFSVSMIFYGAYWVYLFLRRQLK